MKKKLLTILLSIFMFIATFATRVFADEHDHSGWTNWGDDASEQTTLPSTAGDYYLTHDVNISSTWNVPGTTNLCLNGYVIYANSGNFIVITIANGATLNLYDCGTTTHNGYIDTSGLWHLDETNSHSLTTGEIALPIVGGIITGSTDSNCAGGLNVNNSTLNIYGGNISGNKASANADSDGGGIGIYASSKVNMYGGSIIGNYAKRGGGGVACYDNNSEFNMHGGIITNNHATTDGGGVFVANGGTFNMYDGTICNNDAQNCGGGVNVQSIFNMLNGTIEYNIAKPSNDCWGGGGIAFYGNGKGTLVSGKIQYNSSTVNGGGILFLEANNTTGNVSLSGVSITNNNAAANGGGVFVDNSPVKVLLGGNTIIKDNKLSDGNVSNLHLGREVNIRTSNLNIDSSSTKAMDIGLSGRSIKIKNATSGDEAYFFADDEEYDAYYNSDDGFIELSYKITDGAHSTINILKGEDASFTSTAAYPDFFDGTNIKSGCGVKIDGSFIDPLNYTHEPGSTKITLKSSYLSTLSIGNHTLSIVSLNGHADTQFTITRNTPSPTPDPTPRFKIPNTYWSRWNIF